MVAQPALTAITYLHLTSATNPSDVNGLNPSPFGIRAQRPPVSKSSNGTNSSLEIGRKSEVAFRVRLLVKAYTAPETRPSFDCSGTSSDFGAHTWDCDEKIVLCAISTTREIINHKMGILSNSRGYSRQNRWSLDYGEMKESRWHNVRIAKDRSITSCRNIFYSRFYAISAWMKMGTCDLALWYCLVIRLLKNTDLIFFHSMYEVNRTKKFWDNRESRNPLGSTSPPILTNCRDDSISIIAPTS